MNGFKLSWRAAIGIVTLILAAGAMTSVVAENTRTNHKQDTAIEGVIDLQRKQAETNGRLEAQTASTDKAVQQILKLLLEEARLKGRR